MTESQSVHGLAATIRSSTESETFDLGGLSGSTIESVIGHAFDQPFPKMIRITLVVGAGKQARQKYDAQALKAVTSTLQSLGFVEDRGASCIPECAGLYKLQHDTGKNLKTVVVFPKLPTVIDQSSTDTFNNGQTISSANGESLLVHGSLESKIALASLNVFTNMVQSQCPTWSQKKALLNLLDESILAKVNECDQLLVTGQLLSPSQQSFYDACREITDKRDYLHQQLQAHVDRGDLTKVELDHLKHLNEQKMEELRKAGQSIIKAQERHDKLYSIHPVDPPKLKHHAELGKLWKQLAPLQHLDETSNRLLSVQDTKLLGKKMELVQQIHDLENASRGWLEEDKDFDLRVQTSRKLFQAQFGIKNKNNSSKSTTGASSSSLSAKSSSTTPTISSNTKVKVPVSKWISPVGENKQQLAKAKKKAKLQKGDVFGAMMVTEEDNESEDEDSDDDEKQPPPPPLPLDAEKNLASDRGAQASNNRPTATTSSKKKKNKKKPTGDKLTGTEALLEVNAKSSSSKKEEDQQQLTMPWALISIIQTIVVNYLLPFLLAITQFLIARLFGKSKEKKNKKQ